jgi:hypothetical protein
VKKVLEGFEKFARLKEILKESDFSPFNRALFYEKVYTKLFLSSNPDLLLMLVAWELHICFYKMANQFCAIEMEYCL